MQFNNLPIYEGKVVYDEDGMYVISLVDEPATESNFMAFAKSETIQFSIANEEQRMVFGLIMGANQPIYRRDKSGYEYYIIYRPETLRIMAEKYLKNGYQNNVDTMHNWELVDGVNMVQMFIKDTAKGISPVGFEEYEDGSLFGQFHIVNDEIWNAIKDGTFKGFSMAGIWEKEQVYNKIKKADKSIMKIEKIKAALRKMLAEFGSVSTDKGVIMWDGDDELKEGDAVHGVDEEGNEVALEDGVYRTEDNKEITIADGIVTKIEDLEAEVGNGEGEGEGETETEPEEALESEEGEGEAEAEPDPRDEQIANLEAEIARLEQENGELRERIKELEGEPAGESAEEEFKKIENKVSKREQDMINRGYKF